MRKANLTIIFLAIFLFVSTVSVRKARAVWIIPVMSISTVISEVTTIISEISEILAIVESVASQLQVEEGVRGLAKSYMVGLSTDLQERCGGVFAGDRLGEFNGVDAVRNYLSGVGQDYASFDTSATQYVLDAYKNVEELIYVQGEVTSLSALGASWSDNDSLTSVANSVQEYLESNTDAASVLGLSADTLVIAEYLERYKDVLHNLSDIHLEDMENIIEAAKDYIELKSKVTPASCLTTVNDNVKCQIEKTLIGDDPNVYAGDNTRLTEFQTIAAVANSITSVSSNKCKNLKTGAIGVTSLYLSEQDQPTTADAVAEVDAALDNALTCIQSLITTTIDDIAGASVSGSDFGTTVVGALSSYGDLSSYNAATYNSDLAALTDIAANIRTVQYDLDKMAVIGDSGIKSSVSDFFSSFSGADVISNLIQSAYNKGSGTNLGLQGVGSLNFSISDLDGVTEITGELSNIFDGSTEDVKPADVADILNKYLFDTSFESFKGKEYKFNQMEIDYCSGGDCNIGKIASARKMIVSELFKNANKHVLAETMTAYAVAEDSLSERMEGLNNMVTTAEGEEDALASLYMAKKEALRSILANSYLEANKLYQESLELSAAIVTGDNLD